MAEACGFGGGIHGHGGYGTTLIQGNGNGHILAGEADGLGGQGIGIRFHADGLFHSFRSRSFRGCGGEGTGNELAVLEHEAAGKRSGIAAVGADHGASVLGAQRMAVHFFKDFHRGSPAVSGRNGGVDGVHDGGGGDGGTGNGFNVFQAYGQCLAVELSGKLGFLGALAEALGLVRGADGHVLDHHGVVQGVGDGHIAGKALGGALHDAAGSGLFHFHGGGVDGVHHSGGGDGGTGDGLNVFQAHRQCLAVELSGELGFLGALAEAFGFVGSADGQPLDGQAVIQRKVHGDVSGKALGRTGHAGAGSEGGRIRLGGGSGSGFLVLAEHDPCAFLLEDRFSHSLHGFIGVSEHGLGSEGGAGQCLKGTAFHGLDAGELCGELFVQGAGTEAGGFHELVVADLDGSNRALGVKREGHSHRACISLLGSGNHIAEKIAIGVLGRVQTGEVLVLGGVIGNLGIVFCRKHSVIGCAEGIHAMLLNGAGGDGVGNAQRQGRNQSNQAENQIRGTLFGAFHVVTLQYMKFAFFNAEPGA